MKRLFSCVLVVIGLTACGGDEIVDQSNSILPVFDGLKIIPPLLDEVKTAETFKIDNSLDTILISKRGNCIAVPNNCFVHQNGDGVVGLVSLSFTDYLNTSDILLSGIPMEVIENGDTATFQSAGMCKVLAYDQSGVLKLKEDKVIDIGLRSLAQDQNYNLYYFDTLKGKWSEKEKALPLILKDELPLVPINLQKLDSNKILEIEIEDHELRPLYKMWHHSKFSIYGRDTIAKSDGSVWWYDMTINSTQNRDLYDLTFNGVDEESKQYTYNLTVQPVIDSTNYEYELDHFEENMRLYVKRIMETKAELERHKEEGMQIEAEFIQIKKEEKIKSDLQLKEDSLRMVEYNIEDSLRQVQQNLNDSLIKVQKKLWKDQKNDRYKSNRRRIEVMRTFSIQQMGIFNCDRFYLRSNLTTKSIAMLVNKQARQFDSAYLVNIEANAVLKYLKFAINEYVIDLDVSHYVFVGLLGGEIYITRLFLNDLKNDRNRIELQQVSALELKTILN